jgi:hypothetical protein
VWIRVRGQTSAQDVAEHRGLDGPGAAPGAHGRLVDRLGGGEVERLSAGDIVDQSLLDGRQWLPGCSVRDHAVTIGANGLGGNATVFRSASIVQLSRTNRRQRVLKYNGTQDVRPSMFICGRTLRETETVAIGVRQLGSDLFRALAFAIGNENLQHR